MFETYRAALQAAGFTEATEKRGRFFRELTAQTVFQINLTQSGNAVSLCYGILSTAFFQIAGERDLYLKHGVSDSRITLRSKSEQDIRLFYDQHRTKEKDEILAEVKEKRNAFFQQIHAHLKPLGFRKKGTVWTKPLESPYLLIYDLQKSMYSDTDYYNIALARTDHPQSRCGYIRLSHAPFDWQTDTEYLTDRAIRDWLIPIINTPIADLPQSPMGQACGGPCPFPCPNCIFHRNV